MGKVEDTCVWKNQKARKEKGRREGGDDQRRRAVWVEGWVWEGGLSLEVGFCMEKKRR